ncbi:MAG: hypothetical protein FJ149_08225 [Euryarchaeota archaeon]|nr:hypothetical protein [Euryarchaeota archaeon]
MREAVLSLRPDVVALPVSPEGLKGLRAIWKGKKPDIFLSHYEEIYAVKLARYGKVSIPPPSFTGAFAAAAGEGIPVRAVDIDEEGFSDAFVESVSTAGLLYHSLRWRWLRRRRFREPTARDFALAWDRAITSLKGFRNLERRREEHMARELSLLCGRHGKVLAVLELERMEGVLSRLAASGKDARAKGEGGEEE